jgi:hypothetical protein
MGLFIQHISSMKKIFAFPILNSGDNKDAFIKTEAMELLSLKPTLAKPAPRQASIHPTAQSVIHRKQQRTHHLPITDHPRHIPRLQTRMISSKRYIQILRQ